MLYVVVGLGMQKAMSGIRNVIFFWFHNFTKQNGCNGVGTLYREPLGEIVVHYDSIYKFEKKPRCEVYAV